MGTVRFYAKRELRQKFSQFLPFLLVCAALSFAGVSILILGASLTRGALDETLAYIRHLKDAGVDAGVDVYHGNFHGFDALFWTRNAQQAKEELCRRYAGRRRLCLGQEP